MNEVIPVWRNCPQFNRAISLDFWNRMVLFLIAFSGSHFVYYHPDSRRRAVVPKHRNRDMPKGTLLSLLREAGLREKR